MRDDVTDTQTMGADGLDRRQLLKGLLALPGLASGLTPRASADEAEEGEKERPGSRRVVVLGFDGMDPELARRWMDEGELPNLKQLADDGCFRPLATTNPAATPVAWASFATGAGPARTRIFDLLRRRPGTYQVIPGDIWLKRKRATEEGADIITRVVRRVGVGAGVVAAATLLVGQRVVRYLVRRRRASFVFGSAAAGLLVGVVGGSALIGFLAGMLAGSVVADWVPRSYIEYKNPLSCPTFWEVADRTGHRVTVLGVPCAFPPPELKHGKVLSGYPAPDMTAGGYAIYTSAETPPRSNSRRRVFRISAEEAAVETAIVGPFDRVGKEEDSLLNVEPIAHCRIPLTIIPHHDKREVTIQVQGQEQTIGERRWSQLFTLSFDMSPLVREVGLARFCLVKFTPEELRLYLMPINYHPQHLPANVRLSHPPEFLTELTDGVGLFKTAGWAVDTFRPLIDKQIDDGLFLDDLRFTMGKKWEIVFSQLLKNDWDVLVGVFLGSDRVQHMMWRHIDPGHPLHDPEEAKRYGDAILSVYRTLDEWLGMARELLPPEASLFVVSDHGFSSFRKGVNLSRWLKDEGYLTLKSESFLKAQGTGLEFWEATDWARTKAYASSLSGISINVLGREPIGAVEPGVEQQLLREEIRRKIEALTDPETGERVVHRVYRREELYDGPYLEELPDLIVAYERGYRTERATLKVGLTGPVISPNMTKWCGDHITVDPELVPGVFFCNRRITSDDPRLIDLAPTILSLLGVRVPSGMEGQPLTFETPVDEQA